MSAVPGATGVAAARNASTIVPGVTFGAASLLALPGDVAGDPLLALIALDGKGRRLGLRNAISQVNSASSQRHAAWEAQKRALREAAQAASEGGFWHDLGKTCCTVARIGAVVASVGAAVATCGAAAPIAALAIAGAVMSTAAFAQSEWHVLEKFDVDAKLAGHIEIGLTVGGAVCGGAAAVGAGLTSAEAASGVQEWVGVGSRIAGGAAGASSAVAGYAHVREGMAAGKVEQRQADAIAWAAREARLGRLIDEILSEINDAEKSHRSAVDHVSRTLDLRGTTLSIAAARV